MGKMRDRVLEVVSNTHDENGKPIFTEQMIEDYLSAHANSIQRWQWTLHNNDHYTKEDELKSAQNNNGVATVFAGQRKAEHIHLALEFVNAVYYSAVAKAFGLPEGQVQKPLSSYNKFVAMARYQTHEDAEEQAKGKYRYPDSEVHANYDFRTAFDIFTNAAERSKAKRMKKAEVDNMIESIENGSVTPEEIRQKYGYAFYADHEKAILKARTEYIRRYYTPSLRLNFYVDAEGVTHGGRIGKTQLCKMLARSLFPHLLDSECFYEVGSSKSGLQSYREEPVIIWNDMRAVDMIQTFGRAEVLNMLDDHPGITETRVLYGTVVPVQKFNIINGIEPYDDFLNGLAGTYTDKYGNRYEAEDVSQIYGRFPFIIHVSTDWIDFMISRGWMNGTREFEIYDRFTRAIGGIKKLMMGYGGRALNYLGYETAQDVVSHVRALEERDKGNKISRVEDIRPEDIPINLNGAEADELERRMYKIFYDNRVMALGDETNPPIWTFEDWKKNGGNSSGEWVGTAEDGAVRAFTLNEIRKISLEIKAESFEHRYQENERRRAEALVDFSCWFWESPDGGGSDYIDGVLKSADYVMPWDTLKEYIEAFEDGAYVLTYPEDIIRGMIMMPVSRG